MLIVLREEIEPYLNELLRLMRAYLPGLIAVDEEFQRQMTARFIEGLDDEKLKRKLRLHCKRTSCNVGVAYQFVIDWEAAAVQNRIRDGETATVGAGVKSLSILANPSSAGHPPGSAPVYSSSNSSSSASSSSTEIRQLNGRNRGETEDQ